MKRFTFTIVMIICLFTASLAQAPQAFKYQAIARDAVGDILESQSVTFRVSILQTTAYGTLRYQEIHPVVTNDHGLVSLEIGGGVPTYGDFTTVLWGADDFFMKIELDPNGGSSYQEMGTSQLLSVPYALFAGDDGDWIKDGDHLRLASSGNVAIGGGSNSSTKLRVFEEFSTNNDIEDIIEIWRGTTGAASDGIGGGIAFRVETSNGGYTIASRISGLLESAAIGDTWGGLLFETRGYSGSMTPAMYIDPSGYVGLNVANPLYRLDVNGQVRFTFNGVYSAALAVVGSTYSQMLYCSNSIDSDGSAIWGAMTSSSAGADSYGVYGSNSGAGYGVYGIGYSGIGVYGKNDVNENFGYLGNTSYGAYGGNDDGPYGYLGGSYNGAYGYHESGNYGYLGGYSYSVYGNLNNSASQGNFAVYGYAIGNSTVQGSGYSVNGSMGGVKGNSSYGNFYTFGVAGYSYLSDGRSAGVLGARNTASNWGALGYKTSGNSYYGGYFTSYTYGSGKDDEVQTSSGIGAYGDLFGADIHGKVYGAFIEGENYATYTKGNSYQDGLDIHLQENGSNQHTVLYTSVATNASIQTSGYATISNGKASITFDPGFASAVSETAPIIVTATPMGNTNGIYLTEITKSGFKLAENNNGKSNVSISYIAIGKRKGYENPVLANEVIAADYTDKIAQGLHNDMDQDTDGKGLYYENGQLKVGIHPSTIPDPSGVIIEDGENVNSQKGD
jgi:hypothetical protein